MKHIITRAKGGTDERKVHINDCEIPDLWHIAMELKRQGKRTASDFVLETWYLCHDLKRHILEESAKQ